MLKSDNIRNFQARAFAVLDERRPVGTKLPKMKDRTALSDRPAFGEVCGEVINPKDIYTMLA